MDILNGDKYQGIIQWLPNGDGFIIHDKQRCADEVLPYHFGSVSKYSSFTRRLNRWNFIFQQEKNNKKALYFHPLFVRANPSLCLNMRPRPQKNYSQKFRKNSRKHQLQQEQNHDYYSRKGGMMSSPLFNSQMVTHFPSKNTFLDEFHQPKQIMNSSWPYYQESSPFASHFATQQIAHHYQQSACNDKELYRHFHSSGGQAMLSGGNSTLNVQAHRQQLHRGGVTAPHHNPSYKIPTYPVHPMTRNGLVVDTSSSVTEHRMSGPLQSSVSPFATALPSEQYVQFSGDRYMGYNLYYPQPNLCFK
jgi:hypothetical protein